MKAIITAEEHGALDAKLQPEYTVAADGSFVIKLEGDPPGFIDAATHATLRTDRDTMRDRNIALLKDAAIISGVDQVEDLSAIKTKLATFDGVDVARYRSMETELADKGVKDDDPNALKTLLDSALEPVKTEMSQLRTQLETANTERDQAIGAAHRADVERYFGPMLDKASVVPGASVTVLRDVHDDFEWDPDAKAPKARDGKYGIAGAPLTPDEWVLGAKKGNLSFCFTGNRGGGAEAGDEDAIPPGVTIIKNPTPEQIGEHSKLPKEERAKVRFVNE